MKNMSRKVFRRVLACLVVLGLFAVILPLQVHADDVIEFVERKWDGSKVTARIRKSQPTTKVTDSIADWVDWNEGWYRVEGDVLMSEKTTVRVNGDVRLILCDGATLTVGDGIYITEGSKLRVYSQRDNTGRLNAFGSHSGKAGIGGIADKIGGTLVIHGGRIVTKGDTNGAGIDGGNHKSGMEAVFILGGHVSATGGSSGAGIGKGQQNDYMGPVKIFGGTVISYGGKYGAGIGDGEDRGNGPVFIYGGRVTAGGGDYGAGIGGGEGGSQDNPIEIHGGTVNAYSGIYAAGIGGGKYSGGGARGGEVTITDGLITTISMGTGAAIGGGSGNASIPADSPYIGVWKATSAEFKNEPVDINDVLDGQVMTVTLNADGTGVLSSSNEDSNGNWTISGKEIRLKGDSLNMKFSIEDEILITKILGVSISFEKQP